MAATHERIGGRQKGTPNKISLPVRELMVAFVGRRMDVIIAREKEMDAMAIVDQVNILKPLLPYCIAKPAERPPTQGHFTFIQNFDDGKPVPVKSVVQVPGEDDNEEPVSIQ